MNSQSLPIEPDALLIELAQSIRSTPPTSQGRAEIFDRVHSLGAALEAADRKERLQVAEALAAWAAEADPIDAARALVCAGDLLARHPADGARAADYFERALQCEPEYVQALDRLGERLLKQGEHARLERLWGRYLDAIAANPDVSPGERAMAWRRLARLRSGALGDLDGAIEAYERARDERADVHGLTELAEAHLRRDAAGDREAAADLYLEAAELAPGDGSVYRRRALQLNPDRAATPPPLPSSRDAAAHHDHDPAAASPDATDGTMSIHTLPGPSPTGPPPLPSSRHGRGSRASLFSASGAASGEPQPASTRAPRGRASCDESETATDTVRDEPSLLRRESGAAAERAPHNPAPYAGPAPTPDPGKEEDPAERPTHRPKKLRRKRRRRPHAGDSIPSTATVRLKPRHAWAFLAAAVAAGLVVLDVTLPGLPSLERLRALELPRELSPSDALRKLQRSAGKAPTETAQRAPQPTALTPRRLEAPPPTAPPAARLVYVAERSAEAGAPPAPVSVSEAGLGASNVGSGSEQAGEKKARRQSAARDDDGDERDGHDRKRKARRAPRTRARVLNKLTKVRGGHMSRRAVQRALANTVKQLERCYERAPGRKAKLKGRIVMSWQVQANGRVKRVRQPAGSIRDDVARSCAVRAVRSTRFPRPKGGTARVRSAFALASS